MRKTSGELSLPCHCSSRLTSLKVERQIFVEECRKLAAPCPCQETMTLKEYVRHFTPYATEGQLYKPFQMSPCSHCCQKLQSSQNTSGSAVNSHPKLKGFFVCLSFLFFLRDLTKFFVHSLRSWLSEPWSWWCRTVWCFSCLPGLLEVPRRKPHAQVPRSDA